MIPAIDSHVHFWNRRDTPPGMRWDWVEPGSDHTILGDIDAMKSVRYEIDSLWAEARFAGISGAVHVQAAIGSADPVSETRWLSEMAARSQKAERSPIPLRIVAHLDTTDPDRWPDQLERHSQSPLFVGIRDFAIEPALAAGALPDSLRAALSELERRGLVLDLDCEWMYMDRALTLAADHPDLTIVLEHIGFPRRRDDDYFRDWAAAIRRLAAAPNVICKLSGLGMTDRGFTASTIAPWLTTCLDAFGTDRCILGSNWPLDRVASSYDALFAIFREVLGSYPVEEQRLVLNATAARIYRFSGGGAPAARSTPSLPG